MINSVKFSIFCIIYVVFMSMLLSVRTGEDYYSLLGVSRDATEQEIKKSFRKLAKQYHPDRNKESDAQDRFVEIGNAYEVLVNPEKRRIYDQYGEEGLKNGGFQKSPFNFHNFFHPGANSGPHFGGHPFTFDNLFNDVFDDDPFGHDFDDPFGNPFNGFHHFESVHHTQGNGGGGTTCKTVTKVEGNTHITYTVCN